MYAVICVCDVGNIGYIGSEVLKYLGFMSLQACFLPTSSTRKYVNMSYFCVPTIEILQATEI